MFKNIIQLGLIVFLLSNLLSSCASKKNVVYFQDEVEIYTKYQENIAKIRPYDMLSIQVFAADAAATKGFNQEVSSNRNNQDDNIYTVAEDGTIDFPNLGKIHIAGLTRNQAIDFLKTKLSEYIVNPGVNINYKNFKVSILGEVSKPGVYELPNERVTILEAIANAGDLGIRGLRKNIMVIREEDGKINQYFIDITSKNAFNSPVYYLEQNDVVYVEPNNVGVQSSQLGPTFWMTLTSFGLSITTSVITILNNTKK